MISWTENTLTTLASFFGASQDGHSEYTFGSLQLDSHYDSFIILLLAGVLADVEKIRLWDVIRKCGFDPVKWLLTLKRGAEIAWSHYRGESCPFLV